MVSARHLAIAIVAVACITCSTVDDGVGFTPPLVYKRWWAMTAACSGLKGSFESVRWYRAPASAIQATEGAGTAAYWSSTGNRIVLTDNAIANGRIVRHEMLHALSRLHGHPTALFVARCGGVVRCDEACEADGAQTPATSNDTIRVPLDSLGIAIASFPVQPSSAVDDGNFQLIVSVTNRAPHSVVVPLRTKDPAFSVSVSPGNLRLVAEHDVGDKRLALFAAGQTKQFVFDLQANNTTSRVVFTPGEYRFTGSFDGLSTQPLVLTIGR